MDNLLNAGWLFKNFLKHLKKRQLFVYMICYYDLPCLNICYIFHNPFTYLPRYLQPKIPIGA